MRSRAKVTCRKGLARAAKRERGLAQWACLFLIGLAIVGGSALAGPNTTVYQNHLTPIAHPQPILADHPNYIEPVRASVYFETPAIIDDPNADLRVRSWRFSYNARGIIETTNWLRASDTALIMVHPWGIDDGQGWITPEPCGAADFCTPEKNLLVGRHEREIVNPFLASLRGKVKLVMYSLPGMEDPIRKKLYRSYDSKPTEADRQEGAKELAAKLKGFNYNAQPLPSKFELSQRAPLVDYFRMVPGLDAGPKYDPAGFWQLPIPVTNDIDVKPDDVVIYDGLGYPRLRSFLESHGIRHVLLVGYATDMCYRATTAGYLNLSKDFDVFLVGDATLATFPSNSSPAFATNAAVSFAAIDHMVTQMTWINYKEGGFGKH